MAVTAGGSAALTVSLQPAAVQLSEIVTVGYGTQRREDSPAPSPRSTTRELQQTTVNTLEQGLQGRVAGVQVTQGDGAPGGGMRVQHPRRQLDERRVRQPLLRRRRRADRQIGHEQIRRA